MGERGRYYHGQEYSSTPDQCAGIAWVLFSPTLWQATSRVRSSTNRQITFFVRMTAHRLTLTSFDAMCSIQYWTGWAYRGKSGCQDSMRFDTRPAVWFTKSVEILRQHKNSWAIPTSAQQQISTFTLTRRLRLRLPLP